MAIVEMKAQVEWVEGLRVASRVRGFEFIMDEPKSVGGTNEGMNPVEALLSAIGGCKTIVAKSFARRHNIKLEAVTVDVSGVLDTDGYTLKNPDAKIGLSELKTVYHFKADNTPEEIEAYIEFIENTCPVIDTIKNAPNMTHEFRLNE